MIFCFDSGDFNADEVAQLYVTVPNTAGKQHQWSLKNFARVSLNKGASTRISFKLGRDELEQYNEEGIARDLCIPAMHP